MARLTAIVLFSVFLGFAAALAENRLLLFHPNKELALTVPFVVAIGAAFALLRFWPSRR